MHRNSRRIFKIFFLDKKVNINTKIKYDFKKIHALQKCQNSCIRALFT